MKNSRDFKLTITRTLGALTLLVVGGVHFQQYQYEFYSSIPTIGPLFLANFIAATALGLFLLPPVRPSRGRLGKPLDRLAALAGIAVAAGALAALLISEHTPLFGFREHGYRFAIVLAISSEALAIAMLTLFLVCARDRAARQARNSPCEAIRRRGGLWGRVAQDDTASTVLIVYSVRRLTPGSARSADQSPPDGRDLNPARCCR